MGIYVYDERALRYLPPGPCQFPDLVLRLVAAGERVAAFHASDADWFDIGTLDEYERAAREFERAPEKFDVRPPDDRAVGVASACEGNGAGG